ncbi:hypothetical protein M231_02447 [Tremella mesenterica]|uniref:Autophagy-related protein 9 n=1 Tax=Tremella mesenterica TaxID=5217 RepID=A0A4Q1BQW0_TREME|nr:hypothetical protein M231_02447 [Tremella mesenterica]
MSTPNPFTSSPARKPPDPESPSAVLLRELQGEDDVNESGPSRSPNNSRGEPGVDEGPFGEDSQAQRPTHVLESDSESSDGPSESLIFGEHTNTTIKRQSPERIRSEEEGGKVVGQDTIRMEEENMDNRGSSETTRPSRILPPSNISSSTSASTSPGPSTLAYASATGLSPGQSISLDLPHTTLQSSSIVHEASTTHQNLGQRKPPTRIHQIGFRQFHTDSLLHERNHALAQSSVKGKSKRKGGKKYISVAMDDFHDALREPLGEAYKDGDENDLDDERDGILRKGKSRSGSEGGGTRRRGTSSAGRRSRAKGKGKMVTMGKTGLNEYEKALWKWVNVNDLDGFLQEVYDYYKGKGIYCIALARVLNLLTTFFVVAFSAFLLDCIDYSKLWSTTEGPNAIGRLDDVLIEQCITRGSFPHMLFILSVGAFYLFQMASFILSIPRLLEMYRFYTYLLGVPDADIQTLPWPEIVRLIGEIRKHNPVTSLSNGQAGALAQMVGEEENKVIVKLDAHDIANRILRQENYLVALFNKDLLDLRFRLPLPHILIPLIPEHLIAPPYPSLPPVAQGRETERRFLSFGKNVLTNALEWNLRYCLLGYLFDRRGQVRKEFVREKRRKDLVEGLQRRFIFMGILNAIFAPFIVIYLLIWSFFRYFEEYHKNPSSIGSRQYTPYAQWKFREFNELPHLFERRLDMSYPTAKEYIDQFPKERTALVMRFVAFIAGSFAAVLLVASLIDPDLFLHFEITPHRTVLFYLGIFGSVLAMARGMVPEENLVFDPEASLREVVRWTHYLPGGWQGRLHSVMVHAEFSTLFQLKITIFFQELLSVLLTPFVLLFSLPPCAGEIIDFFREFTVHVDGVGYVCSFAVFDFGRPALVQKDIHPKGASTNTNININTNTNTNANANSNTNANSNLNTTNDPKLNPDSMPDKDAKSDQTDISTKKKITEETTMKRGKDKNRNRANENKMEKSFLHFKATHPDWIPSDPASSIFLDKLVGLSVPQNHTLGNPVLVGGKGTNGMGGVNDRYGDTLGIVPRGMIGSVYGARGMTGSVYGARGMNSSVYGGRGLGVDSPWFDERTIGKSPELLRRNLEPMQEEEERKVSGGRIQDKQAGGVKGDGSEQDESHDLRDGGRKRGNELDDPETEELGWGEGLSRRDQEESEDEQEGFLRDAGMMGLLQQVLGR